MNIYITSSKISVGYLPGMRLLWAYIIHGKISYGHSLSLLPKVIYHIAGKFGGY